MNVSTTSIIQSWPEHWTAMNQQNSTFLEFLRSTHLLFPMRGFEHTAELQAPSIPFQPDADGHPMIKKAGVWVRWDAIKAMGLCYDSKTLLLLDSAGAEWNYLPDQGLTQIQRYNNIFPICRLSAGALQALDHSTPKTEAQIGQRHYLQVTTTGATQLERIGHVAIRLIGPEGVYSISYETTKPPTNICALHAIISNRNGYTTAQDYSEFRSFKKRYTTTLSVSEEHFTAALGKARELAQTPLRFNHLRQNCALFATTILKAANIEIDLFRYPSEFVYDLLPPLEKIPYIGCVLGKIRNLIKAVFHILAAIIPSPIKKCLQWAVSIITYIPLKILIVIRNLALICLGAARQAEPRVVEPAVEPEDSKTLGNFKALMPCWWRDLWRDETGLIASPLMIAQWQDRDMKNHTHMHTYDGSPKLYIVPPIPNA